MRDYATYSGDALYLCGIQADFYLHPEPRTLAGTNPPTYWPLGIVMDPVEIEGVFEALDEDDSGSIDLDEFKKMWAFLGFKDREQVTIFSRAWFFQITDAWRALSAGGRAADGVGGPAWR